LFCTSQHATFSRPPEWWQQTFSNAIAAFGRMVMVMSPWNSPITLTRTWCIFELWACYTHRCRFEVALPAPQRLKFLSDIARDAGAFHDMLANVSSRSSQCSRDTDRQRIFDAVEASIGFVAMDRAVIETLEGWMLQHLRNQMQAASCSLERARWKSALASLHEARGEFELGLSLNEEVLAIRLCELGDDDLLTIQAHINVAASLQDAGKVGEALPMLTKSWQALRAIHGDDHADTIEAASSVASCCFDAGAYERAECMYKECLARRRSVRGERPREMIEMMQGVASCLSMRGACDEAASLMRECLDLARTDFGLEHPLTMDSMDLLADVLLECGSFKEAEELLTQCLDSSNRLLGAEHPHVSCCFFLSTYVSLCDPCADIVFSIEVGGVLV
jgi:tetratricopeptide (TPR) repeat protein